ncbi:MAG: cytochrome c3 family protein [Chloroflexi bacterium]|nr:cytochrome c3 family protein [Chloroflexota bacterium]
MRVVMRVVMRMSCKTVWLLAAAACALLILPGVVQANGGPHGDYRDATNLTDRCAACHRVHQGVSEGKLLKAESQYALCLTCHNGAGSVLDVLDGVRVAGPGYTPANLISLDGNVVPRDSSASNIYVSLAPYGELSVPPSGPSTAFAYVTVRIRNRTGADFIAGLAATDSQVSGAAGSFGASDFVATTRHTSSSDSDAENPGNPTETPITSVTVQANGTGYVLLRVKVTPSATAGASNLTAVAITAGGQMANVRAQVRVGEPTLPVLNGGGFNFVGTKPTTSRHNANPADNSLNPWGFGGSAETTNYAAGGTGKAANTGENPNALAEPLQCTSCHNPHGNTNYRMLKTYPRANNNTYAADVKAWYSDASNPSPAYVANEGNRALEAGAPADKYIKEYYASYVDNSKGISSFCGGCHTAYPSNSAGVGLASTTGFGSVIHYRHRTEMPYDGWTNPNTGSPSQNPETNPIAGTGGTGTFPALRLASNASNDNKVVTCLTCHRAHGTSAVMSGYALKKSLGGLADEDLTPAQIGESRSSLLVMDNRGFCQACHQW